MTDRIAHTLLWLLGIQLPAGSEATQLQFEGAWEWRPGMVVLISLLGLACVGFVAWIYVRERSTAGRGLRILLAGLRLSALALVLLVMIYGLSLRRIHNSLPCLAVMLDESGSMAEQDDYEDSSIR